MDITAQAVQHLRMRTNVSMMACKKALTEAGGDEEKAIEILRKSGEAKAQAKADREAKEGVVAIVTSGNKACAAVVNCETDFVARNESFVALAEKIAQLFLAKGEDARSEAEAVAKEAVVTMGENVVLGNVAYVEGATLGSYLHSNKKIGTIVALSSGDEATAKDVAMHVAAMSPLCLAPEEVPTDLMDKEKDIYKEQLRNEGKPEAMLDKILEGKMKKFTEEQALLTQNFVKDPSKQIKDILGGATIVGFKRLEV